jgi:hypothetical protein
MQRNTKEWIQYGSAISMLASGILLTFLCFFLNHYEVKDSVLWYVAQTLVYAGSVFGVSVYIKTKYGEVKNYIDDKLSPERDGKEDKFGNR